MTKKLLQSAAALSSSSIVAWRRRALGLSWLNFASSMKDLFLLMYHEKRAEEHVKRPEIVFCSSYSKTQNLAAPRERVTPFGFGFRATIHCFPEGRK